MNSWSSLGSVRAGMCLCAAALLFTSQGFADEPKLPPLTSVSGSPRLPGKFVWADLATDDLAAAQKFYSGLFGWTFAQVGNYAIAANEERPLCGMLQVRRPANRPDARPRWVGYISVASVAKAQRAVTRSGGRVLAEPIIFPKRGEQALFADPEGTIFGVMKSSSGDPEDFLPDPGDWVWIQLLSRNARNAAEFYSEVAGYEIIENIMTNRVSDFVLASKGYARATVRTIPSRNAQVQPNWLPFVRVSSVAEAVARAEQLGGKTLIAPNPDLREGKVAVIADPTGAAIGLLEWINPPVKGAS